MPQPPIPAVYRRWFQQGRGFPDPRPAAIPGTCAAAALSVTLVNQMTGDLGAQVREVARVWQVEKAITSRSAWRLMESWVRGPAEVGARSLGWDRAIVEALHGLG